MVHGRGRCCVLIYVRCLECSLPCGGGVRKREVLCFDLCTLFTVFTAMWGRSQEEGGAVFWSVYLVYSVRCHVGEESGSGRCCVLICVPCLQCSLPCGGGVRKREVLCFAGHKLVSVADCNTNTKPDPYEDCHLEPCDEGTKQRLFEHKKVLKPSS